MVRYTKVVQSSYLDEDYHDLIQKLRNLHDKEPVEIQKDMSLNDYII